MSRVNLVPLTQPVPTYLIKINTTAFQSKKGSLLQRTKQQCVPKYWHKLHMDQKRIGPSSEDRLSQLTTTQIDRIIDMQKMQSSLASSRSKSKDVYFNFKPKSSNFHTHSYQASFLAKINNIAIKRNIRHQSADLGIYVGQNESASNTKLTAVPFKYKKQYRVDQNKRRKNKKYHPQDDDQKSVASIKDQYEIFQKKVEEIGPKMGSFASRRRKTTMGGCIKKRWFYGMSNAYLQKQQKSPFAQESTQSIGRQVKIDIQNQVSPLKGSIYKIITPHHRSFSTNITQQSIKHQQPLQRYKLPRVVTVQ